VREYLEKNYAETSGDDTVKLALCALLEVCVFSLLSLCDPCTDKIKMRLRVKAKAKHLFISSCFVRTSALLSQLFQPKPFVSKST